MSFFYLWASLFSEFFVEGLRVVCNVALPYCLGLSLVAWVGHLLISRGWLELFEAVPSESSSEFDDCPQNHADEYQDYGDEEGKP